MCQESIFLGCIRILDYCYARADWHTKQDLSMLQDEREKGNVRPLLPLFRM